MENFKNNIISSDYSLRDALARLDQIGIYGNVLFILESNGKLRGTITDGDIRRGLLKGASIDDLALSVANLAYYSLNLYNGSVDIDAIKRLKLKKIKLVPLLDENSHLIKIIDIDSYRGFLPIDVFIMAGGKGARLMPLTKDCPKPMLVIGDKPILEHNIDRLISFGVERFIISINYLGDVIINHFKNGEEKGVNITYIQESEPLGTIGSISLAPEFKNDYVLVMNSDLLTDVDYLDFFEHFMEMGSHLSVATIPYHVDIPYAVLEMDTNSFVSSLSEKPKYTYYSNAGIYLLKKEVISLVPYNEFFNATDLIEAIIKNKDKVSSFPILGYWLDIGKMPDFIKAQEDIKHIRI
jgi:dTDP-glucose pyrophosphorylase